MQRAERRFLAKEGAAPFAARVEALEEEPEAFTKAFVARYPQCEATLLCDEDVAYFINLCQDLRNGKPVNFVPVIDENLDYWVKKDSLWCSEQVDAVVGRDAGRVCILHGPVAARYSLIADEPIADILGGIHRGVIDRLLQPDAAALPPSQSLGGRTLEAHGDEVPAVTALAPGALSCAPWSELVTASQRVVQGRRWIPNPIALLCAREGCERRATTSADTFELVDTASGQVEATVHFDAAASKVSLEVLDAEVGASLTHTFDFVPGRAPMLLQQRTEVAQAEIKTLYRTVWGCGEGPAVVGLRDTFSDSVIVTQEDLAGFNKAIGCGGPDEGSIDISTMAGWKSIIGALFSDELSGNLLKLVHMTHGYVLTPPQAQRTLVQAGERLDSEARVVSVQIVPGVGKKISVQGSLSRYRSSTESSAGEADVKYEWLEIRSEFLIRGDFHDHAASFSSRAYDATIRLTTTVKAALVRSRAWLKLLDGADAAVVEGGLLVFRLRTVTESGAAGSLCDIVVEGEVLAQVSAGAAEHVSAEDEEGTFLDTRRGGRALLRKIGAVSFASAAGETFAANPVTSFLDRERDPVNAGTIFESGGHEMLAEPVVVTAPTQSLDYALASRDLNPIHRSRPLATLAQLPHGSTIVHGMWTAAMARGVLETTVAGGDATASASGQPAASTRIASYSVDFVGMLFPGEQVVVTVQHTGVVAGRLVATVRVHKLRGERELVMKGRAEVEQPKTAYLFTGQGSAAIGMVSSRLPPLAHGIAATDYFLLLFAALGHGPIRRERGSEARVGYCRYSPSRPLRLFDHRHHLAQS